MKEVSRSVSGRRSIPFEIYKRQQARISRRTLYRISAFYYGYGILISVLAFRSAHPILAAAFLIIGVVFWTLVEYLAHRFMLHGHFPDGEGIVQHFLHRRVDPLHWEHHSNPYDGGHINADLPDLLPLFFVTAPLSFIAPIYTLPVFLASIVASYVTEEWVHHSVHFYNFRNLYFRYLRRHHFYHHSPRGMEQGYGLTSGFWDMVFGTRFPAHVRSALYRRGRRQRL